MAHWSVPYVGLPWLEHGLTRDGVDCWGIVRLVYAEVLGIDVPDYSSRVASLRERAEIAAIFAGATAGKPWRCTFKGEVLQDLDVAVFRINGIDSHAGLVVLTDAGPRMLHAARGRDTAVVSLLDPAWADRLSGVYRHAEVAERGLVAA